MELHGSVIIITGASSGIGAATAKELARRGATVVLAARRAAELRLLTESLVAQGGRALAVPTDVRRRQEIDDLIQTTLDTYGRIDVLVNNAGTSTGGSVVDSDDAEMQHNVEVNLLAPARCIQAVLPSMRRRRSGVIVNVGSILGEVATSGLYSATKFGLRGLNDSLRRRVRNDQIDLVLIEPGFIRTPMTARARLPMPGPEIVARAIVSAIERPRRKIIVPWYYAPPIYLSKMLPWLTDRLVGSRAFLRRFMGAGV